MSTASVVPLDGGRVATGWFTAVTATAIKKGQLLILDNASTGQGCVKPIADSTAINTANIEGGIVGLAQNSCTAAEATAGAAIGVDILDGRSGLDCPTYGTAPTAALLGVAPTTYYALRNDANGFPELNLGDTTTPLARFLNYSLASVGTPLDGQAPALGDGAIGDRVLVGIIPAARHYTI